MGYVSVCRRAKDLLELKCEQSYPILPFLPSLLQDTKFTFRRPCGTPFFSEHSEAEGGNSRDYSNPLSPIKNIFCSIQCENEQAIIADNSSVIPESISYFGTIPH